jgi:Caudovirus prohead serine protease
MNDTLVMFGGAVKALGEGRVGGYLITFSDAASPDLTGEYFTKDTDYDLADGDTRSVYYAHGLDEQLGVKKIGRFTAKTDAIGIWVEAQLNLRDEYEQAIANLAAKGKLGWSSGAPAHLVARKSIETKDGATVREITHWPIAEASLTPSPAEPRNGAVSMKSLPALLGIGPTMHTKALPSGMSYDDLRTLLQDELNEDFPDDDDDPDSWNRGLWIRDVYDDAVVYADEEDLFRRTYQVTAGNDIVWGPEESVVRVTTYVTATDVDDATEGDAGIVPATMSYERHLTAALAAVKGVIDRGFAINELRIKSGRVFSAANRKKLREMHTQMQTAHAAMGTHIATMQALLNETEPAAKKTTEVEQIYIRMLAREAAALGVEITA